MKDSAEWLVLLPGRMPAYITPEQYQANVARMAANRQTAATPGAPHSVETLARVAGMSRSMFMHRFAAVVGRPPMEVLRDLRMKQAANYLRHQDLTVEEVASQAGYTSHSSFVRAFRKAHGVDPRTFRTRSK